MHVLITAGGTREYIDPIRYITNASTGKMGYALARAALDAGHEVTLISAPTDRSVPEGSTLIAVQTARDMYRAVQDCFGRCDVLIMAAAVSDYTVAEPAERKLKKQDTGMTLHLEPTVDILQWAGAEKQRRDRRTDNRGRKAGGRRHSSLGLGPLVIGFALEDEDLQACAEAKLQRKNMNMIIANRPRAIGADQSELHVKTPDSPWQVLPMADKLVQARQIIRMIEALRVG